MHYWRRNSFEKLAELQSALAGEPALSDYREYLRLLEEGLREEALKKIQSLLATLQILPEWKKRSLVSLMLRATEPESGHRLLPHPLYEGFVRPVLALWRKELPDDPEPLRWSFSIDDLAQAVQLDPACDHTRRKLVVRILGFIGDCAHELPAGYLGDIKEDLDLLALARKEAALLCDPEIKAKYLQMIYEEECEIKEFAKFRASSENHEITRKEQEV